MPTQPTSSLASEDALELYLTLDIGNRVPALQQEADATVRLLAAILEGLDREVSGQGAEDRAEDAAPGP